MFDLAWSEMAVIVLVALVVIGPKDLPRLAREVGKWTGKARAMAREFQRNLDDMAREADLQDIKAQVDKVSRTSLTDTLRDTLDPDRSIEKATRIDDPFKDLPPKPLADEPKPEEPPATLSITAEADAVARIEQSLAASDAAAPAVETAAPKPDKTG